MAKTATLTVTVGLSGDGFAGGPLFTSLSQNTSALPPATLIAPNLGTFSVNVPAAAQGVVIVPPPNSTVTKILRGAAPDTGIILHNTLPTILSLTPGVVASFFINFSAAETVSIIWL